MNIGDAVLVMREGVCVRRAGWNGKGMFLYLVPGSKFKVNRPPLMGIYPEGTEVEYHAHVDMKTATGRSRALALLADRPPRRRLGDRPWRSISDGGVSPRTNAYAYGADISYKSDRQRRAMHAAARGSSKLGIPKSVGMSYASHGMKPKPRMNGLMPKRMKELKP